MIPQLLRKQPYIGAASYQQVQDPGHHAIYGYDLFVPSPQPADTPLKVSFFVSNTGAAGLINIGARSTWEGVVASQAGYVLASFTPYALTLEPGQKSGVLLVTSKPVGSAWDGQTLTVYVGPSSAFLPSAAGNTGAALPAYAFIGSNIQDLNTSGLLTGTVTIGTSSAATGSSSSSGSSGSSGGSSSTGTSSGGFYRASLALLSIPTAQANNQPATATVAIANTGTLSGTWTVTGTFGSGASWIPQTVSLAPGVSQTLTMQTNGGINPVNAGASFPVTFSVQGPGATGSVSGTLLVASAASSGSGQAQPSSGSAAGAGSSANGAATSASGAGTVATPKLGTGTLVALGVGAALVVGGGIWLGTSGKRRAPVAAGYEP